MQIPINCYHMVFCHCVVVIIQGMNIILLSHGILSLYYGYNSRHECYLVIFFLVAHVKRPLQKLIEEGDDGKVSCHSASPPVWTHQGKVLPEHFGKVELTFHSITKQNAGVYKCHGTTTDKYSFVETFILVVTSK